MLHYIPIPYTCYITSPYPTRVTLHPHTLHLLHYIPIPYIILNCWWPDNNQNCVSEDFLGEEMKCLSLGPGGGGGGWGGRAGGWRSGGADSHLDGLLHRTTRAPGHRPLITSY